MVVNNYYKEFKNNVSLHMTNDSERSSVYLCSIIEFKNLDKYQENVRKNNFNFTKIRRKIFFRDIAENR